MSRATNDLTQVRLYLGPGLLNMVNTAIAYASAVPLLFALSPKLTLITLAVYPPSFFAVQRVSRWLYQQNLAQQAQMGKVSNFV